MKMSTVKRISLLLAATMLTGMLSACGDSGQKEQKSSSENESGTVNLTFGIHVADLEKQEPQIYDVLKAFMDANPDIKIEILGTANADEQDKQMKLDAESGTLPDIFWTQPGVAKDMYEAGYIMELSDLLDYDSEVSDSLKEALFTVKEDGTANEDGKFWGLPYQKMVTGFWINKTVFEENNIELPHNGTTFEEFMEIVKILDEKGITTISNGAKTPYSVWAFQTMFVRYGFLEHLQGIREGSDSFVNEDFLNYFEMIDQLRQAGAFPANVTTQDYFQAKEAFLSGDAAMLDSGQWDASEVNEKFGDQATFWWGPTFSNGVGNQNVGSMALTNNLRVSAKVENDEVKKEAVQRFFKFWLSEEADKIRIKYGTMPLSSTSEEETDNKAFNAMLSAMKEEGWSSISVVPAQIVPEVVMNSMYDAIYGVMSGIYSPQEACEVIQEAQERQE